MRLITNTIEPAVIKKMNKGQKLDVGSVCTLFGWFRVKLFWEAPDENTRRMNLSPEFLEPYVKLASLIDEDTANLMSTDDIIQMINVFTELD